MWQPDLMRCHVCENRQVVPISFLFFSVTFSVAEAIQIHKTKDTLIIIIAISKNRLKSLIPVYCCKNFAQISCQNINSICSFLKAHELHIARNENIHR